MEQPACRTLALEFLPKQCCIVMYQGAQQPSDVAWDLHIEQLRKHVDRQGELKILVITEGGRPNKAQQARLGEVAQGHVSRTAVVSATVAVRFVVSTIALMKPNLRYFSPDQLPEAFEHLGLTTDDRILVEQTVERLRQYVHAA